MADTSASTARVVGRESLWLVTGSVVNGVAAFLFIALGTDAYGAEGFAAASVVWSIWSMGTAVLTFPMQHWTIRQLRRGGSSDRVQATFVHIAGWAAVVGACVAAGGWLVGERVLRTTSVVSPVTIVVLLAGAVPLGHVVGRLVASDRYRAAGLMVGGGNIVRLVVAAGLVVVGVSSDMFVVALAAGPILLLLWPSLMRPAPSGTPTTNALDVVELSVANSLAQMTLAGGPLLIAALGSSDRLVSALFATMALARAPYLVLLGASMRLTSLWSDPSRRAPSHLAIGLATIATAVVAGVASGVVGPPTVALLFGPDTALSAVATGWIAVGATLALGTLVLTSSHTARDATRPLVRSWIGAVAVGAIGILVPGDALTKTLVWFLTTELVAVLLLSLRAPDPQEPRP